MKLACIDDQLLGFLEAISEFNIDEDISQLREKLSLNTIRNNQEIESIKNIQVEDRVIKCSHHDFEVIARIYKNTEQIQSGPVPVLIWIHGGGMIFCSIDDYTHQIATLAKQVGCCIVSVNYRLAPEHPYPTPLEDCYSCLAWLYNNALELNIDIQRIAVGGLSAGGNLAAALSLLTRDRGEYPICFQLLLCPMLDPFSSSHAYERITDKRLWNLNSNQIAWQAYLNNIDPIPGYAAPLLEESLSGLPPAYLLVGDQDVFVDEDIQYAQALVSAGVPTELHIVPGAFHGFEFAVPEAAISQRAWCSHRDALRRAFTLTQKDL